MVHVVAGSTDSSPVVAMQIYVDNSLTYQVNASTVDTFVNLAVGNHGVTVQGWDSTGATFKSMVQGARQPPCALTPPTQPVPLPSLPPFSGSPRPSPLHPPPPVP